MNIDYTQRDLIRWIEAEGTRTTGRRYRIDFEALNIQSLGEFQRLLRDLETEKQRATNQAKLLPWRNH